MFQSLLVFEVLVFLQYFEWSLLHMVVQITLDSVVFVQVPICSTMGCI